jgi:broad specificity phosphatase PhoE
VVVIRHGETEWSRTGQHTGWTDLPLDDRGRQQAAELRDRLQGWRFTAVFSSPLRRALDTCRLAGLAQEPLVRDDLREWNYGRYEGLTTQQIQARRPGWSLWRDGCPEGEDAAAVGQRADRVLAEIRSMPGDACVVAHGHLLRVLGVRWLGLPPQEGRHFALAAAGISVLGFEHEDLVFSSWNATPSS